MKIKTCIIVFSDDWGEHPSSCQHLFRYVPEELPVLWVNTIGMRNPKLTLRDMKKAFSKSKRMIQDFLKGSRARRISHGADFYTLQPFQIPFSNIPFIRKINRFLVCSSVKKRLVTLNMSSLIFVTTTPNACDYAGSFGEGRVVYYCVDDFSEWPGLEKELVRSMEEDLISKTDIFIATSEKLYERLSGYGKEVHLLTHGVDLDFFRKIPDKEHILLERIPKPRIGYFGLFDDRSDKELLFKVAELMPDVSFVITGNVETDISLLCQAKNIYFTGAIPYAELPAMAKGWDACILPYKVNKLTDAIQPLKMKEYLATGKPIVSTPIKEALNLNDFIFVVKTADAWVEAIRLCINGVLLVNKSGDRESYLEKESWTEKAREFFGYCISSTR